MATKATTLTRQIPSITYRLQEWILAWGFKTLVYSVLGLTRTFKPAVYRKYLPTYTKYYPIRPGLQCRIHIPKSFSSGSKLPLYIEIHGGGFTICDAQLDDKICHYISNTLNCVVVSLSYRLAPTHPFPVPVDDCTELALAAINDSDLPIDRTKIAIAGSSAGGNLALSVAQDPQLKAQVKAVVAFYPVCDFSSTFAGDFRDKPAGSDGKGAAKDGLRNLSHIFNWAYIPYGQDLTDPRLSPIYADKTALPENIFFIAAQYDKLCTEAFSMAKRLAGDENLKEDERWQKNGICWDRADGELHGFIEKGWETELSGTQGEGLWTKDIDALLIRLCDWLKKVWDV